MGEWKVSVSLRVTAAEKADLEAFAKQDRRSVGNLGMILLTWAVEQLKACGGSTEKLLRRNVPEPRNPDGNYRRGKQGQHPPG
jgi:hypothetical protein